MNANEKNTANSFEQTLDSSKEKVYVENNKENLKIKKNKNKSNKWKKFFYGIGKEFGRISWINKKEIGTSFAIVLVVIIFFALIFTGISVLMTFV